MMGNADVGPLPVQRPNLNGTRGGAISNAGVHSEPVMSNELKAPFPAFGGKSKVASLVWSKLGNPDNYVEPFANSAAVLLLRPDPPKVETLNDLDCYIANFWRATKQEPERVVDYADGPVNETDLHARHRWLVLSDDAEAFRQRMRTDPDYYDPKVAGYWCWGLCCWIGSGWCSIGAEWEQTPASQQTLTGVHGEIGLHQKRPRAHRAAGSSNKPCNLPGVLAGDVSERRPYLGTGHTDGEGGACPGHGIHAKGEGLDQTRPVLEGRGVHGEAELSQAIPKVSEGRRFGGTGVHGSHVDGNRPQLADAYSRGRGVNGNDEAGTCAQRRAWLLDWFGRLRDRLRTVRVCCGDWRRVCSSESVTTRLGITGVFLDPPYGTAAKRSKKLYAVDSLTVAQDVLAWCLEWGGNPSMRIVLAGYAGEHEALEAAGWTVEYWKASGGYGNRSDTGKANAKRERLWCSPHCSNRGLFDPEWTA
jgi:hypothetical protein